MPTPFHHLVAAQKLLIDPQIPTAWRDLLNSERPAFLTGSIAADARINSGLKRADTHFYAYGEAMTEHPWRVMLARHESLREAQDRAHQVFIAAYVAHLAMDEIWTLEMLIQHFWEQEWETSEKRFFALHLLLSSMDERDYTLLADWQAATLYRATPADWLPFMRDADLVGWRDFIASQITDGSQTLAVLSQRVDSRPADFRAILDSAAEMQATLWDHVPKSRLLEVEAQMYEFAREQLKIYLAECGL